MWSGMVGNCAFNSWNICMTRTLDDLRFVPANITGHYGESRNHITYMVLWRFLVRFIQFSHSVTHNTITRHKGTKKEGDKSFCCVKTGDFALT